jgi:hypothetical protein
MRLAVACLAQRIRLAAPGAQGEQQAPSLAGQVTGQAVIVGGHQASAPS